jgi:succinoglycan biosynthesis protein ExoW
MITVGVVIPYYQRDAGLLGAAIASVLAQDLQNVALRIVVVDDQSPRAAADDLAAISVPAPHRLDLLSQDNGGPGAARNRGLDHLAGTPIDYVAFLDSDDRWAPDHLRTALAVLGSDADFYFDDHVRVQYAYESYFAAHGRLARWQADQLIAPLPIVGDAFECAPDGLIRFLLEDHPAQSSTVVFRLTDATRPLRFDASLRSLGEDLMFWIDLAKAARRTRLATAIGVTCGAGVSIFHSALSWDHPDAPLRFANSLLLWSKIGARADLSAAERALAQERVSGFERGFTYIWLRHLLRRRRWHARSLALVREQLGWGMGRMVPAAAALAARRARSLPLFPEH